MLGVQESLLTRMEAAADIPSRPRRLGYTGEELRRLLRNLRRIIKRTA
jgi:hypothetical protein